MQGGAGYATETYVQILRCTENTVSHALYILDVNECLTDNGGCEHVCNNTLGSHICSCRDGYQLLGSSCIGESIKTFGSLWNFSLYLLCHIDVIECDSNNGGCADVCENNNGSFTCSCSAGYEFEPGDDGDSTNAGRQCQGSYRKLSALRRTII